MENILTDQEAKLLAVSFEILSEWAKLWVEVSSGALTKEQAFDQFNEFLVPIGQVISLALALPGVSEQILKIQEKAEQQSFPL